jgi:predicted HTH domain antitoxin
MVITVELPESVCVAARVRPEDLPELVRETLAAELYRRGRASLAKAAEIAGLARADMGEFLVRHDLHLAYDAADAAADWDAVEKALAQ